MKLISTIFAALLLTAGAAHADINDKDNHVEGVGGHTLNELQKQGKPTEAEKTLDRGKDNHEEGVGGHGLYEATKGK